MEKNIDKLEVVSSKINKKEYDLNKISEEEKFLLFLVESEGKDKKECEDLYLNKYKLNVKSRGVNGYRRIERYFGVKGSSGVVKWNEEKRKEVEEVRKKELKNIDINYIDIVEKVRNLKNKNKGSNFLSINKMNI